MQSGGTVLKGVLTASYTRSCTNRPFLLESTIRAILTAPNIRMQLLGILKSFGRKLGEKPNLQSHETYLDAIVGRARKVFALLVLCNQEPFIFDFVQTGIDDSRLPLTRSQTASIPGIPDIVFEKQWEVQAQVFTRGCDLDLPSSVILPFTSEDFLGKGVDRITLPTEHAINFGQSMDQNPSHQPSIVVARKTIATKEAAKSDQRSLQDAFQREKSVLQRLLSLGTGHRHLVELFACYRLDSSYYLLLTCADYDLETLFREPSRRLDFGLTSEQQCATLYGCFYCLASALDYLHRLPVYHPGLDLDEIIYHHDLKPANILIRGNTFMIADFGLSGLKQQDDTKTDWHGGTYSYSPPEYFSSANITLASGGRKVDVWGLGCIFSELLTFIVLENVTNGVSNFKRMREEGPSKHLFSPGAPDSSFHNNLPEVRSWLSTVLAEDDRSPIATLVVELIEETLNIDPVKRPSAEVVSERLTRILSDDQLRICGCGSRPAGTD
ncbi:hypothetical protein BP6252_14156 [Coleophoma cylindrospora]|uniref:non-specific serine/threonine protein kinase n=1 Tax=Coleophoma cylindrospora TaxID=1849047 RepID=A0A3D8Q4X8_9HELO|nr:hypothetical protein BP6252_14156 [Coleophoma cylindrospora]